MDEGMDGCETVNLGDLRSFWGITATQWKLIPESINAY